MTGRLRGRTSLITGTSSGLGRAIAVAYAKEGANVICADLAPTARLTLPGENDRATHLIIEDSGGNATFVKCDVADPTDMQNAVKEAVDKYGRLDM